MQEFLRWLASKKGIELEPGADLRFELTGFPGGGLALLVLLGALLALLTIIYIYRRDGRNLSVGQRLVLSTLRVLAVLVALFVVFEPSIVAVKKDVRDGHVILLLDVSQSMGHKDAYRRESVRKLQESWRALGVADPASSPRLDMAKTFLAREDFELIKKLNEKNKVLLYGFASGLQPMPLVAAQTPPEKAPGSGQEEEEQDQRVPPRPDLQLIKADGRYSNIGGAIRSALEKSRDASIAAVIVLSDGRRNIGAQGAEVARFLTQRKVDYTLIVGVGDPSEAQTVQVSRIEAPEKAFQKDPFKIRATVASQGYDDLSLIVRLLQMPEGGGVGTMVQSQDVRLGGDHQEVELEFENISEDKAGIYTYKVEVQPPSGEPPSPERHSKQARVEILDRQTKVLLVAGSPLHEYQILKNLLQRDKTIELACWLLSADKEFAQDGNVSLKALPEDRKELEPYDVFIFMDPDQRLLEPEFCEMVAKQVEENGAGLWWVCGEKYTLEALYASSSTAPLAELLPVIPNLELADLIVGYGRPWSRPWPYELTPVGREHPAIRIVDAGKDQNKIIWDQLPRWHFAFPVLRSKPAASVLCVTSHEKLRTSHGPMPMVACQFVGAGRVLFSATDETYRWRSRYEEQFDRYWVKGVRYLFEGRLSAGNSRLRIDISSDKLELGEPVKVTVEAKDESYQPLLADSYDLQVNRESEPAMSFELRSIEGAPGQFEATFRPNKTGFYRIAPATSNGTPVEATFQVVAAAVEREGPADLAELGAIAAARGGRLLETPGELREAVDMIPSRTTTSIYRSPHAMWDTWVTIALILTLLAAEWWLRKWWNLL